MQGVIGKKCSPCCLKKRRTNLQGTIGGTA